MITDNGFIRPTLSELETQIKTNFKNKFGIGDNTPALEPEEFLGALSSILASVKSDLYEILEDTYYAQFLTTAEGVALDRQATPTTRRGETQAEVVLKLTGTPTTNIPSGTVFETEDSRQYVTQEAVVIDAYGEVEVDALAAIAGIVGNSPIGAIRFIPTPISGLTSVTNEAPAQNGLNTETDADFRTRAINERSADRTSSLLAIVNRVLEINNVSDAIGIENTTDDYDSDNRPPGSVEISVRGGTDNDIAQVILDTKSAGVETFGTEEVILLDQSGNSKSIFFSRVTDVAIFVLVNITTNLNYVDANDNFIKQRILDYIGGVNPDSETSLGLGIGEDVLAWKAEASLFELDNRDAILGIDDVEVLIGVDENYIDQMSIDISNVEEAFTDFANIEINKT